MALRTWADVRARIGREGVTKRSIAVAMGERPDAFSRAINDKSGTPTRAWIARFTDAHDALTRDIPTA